MFRFTLDFTLIACTLTTVSWHRLVYTALYVFLTIKLIPRNPVLLYACILPFLNCYKLILFFIAGILICFPFYHCIIVVAVSGVIWSRYGVVIIPVSLMRCLYYIEIVKQIWKAGYDETVVLHLRWWSPTSIVSSSILLYSILFLCFALSQIWYKWNCG